MKQNQVLTVKSVEEHLVQVFLLNASLQLDVIK